MEPKRMADQIYKAEHERDELKRQNVSMRAAITAALKLNDGHLGECPIQLTACMRIMGEDVDVGPCSPECHAMRASIGLAEAE